MKTKERKRGISFIVLIITIIVVIILAAVVILTLSKNNPIESAKGARFKEDVRTFQDELALAVSKEYTSAGGHRDTKITTSDFNEIQGYIPSFSEKYKGKFVIQDDELKYTNKVEDNEKEWLDKINVSKYALLPKEYQQVQYIESTGSQYIILGEKVNLINKSVIELAFSSIKDSFVLGNPDNNTGQHTKFSYIFVSLSSTCQWQYKYNEGNTWRWVDKIPNTNIKYKVETFFEPGNQYCKLDDEEIIKTNYNDIVNLPTQLQLFKANTDWSSNVKLYSLQLKNNDSLIKNFIPCYSTSTVTNVDGEMCEKGTAGLYDLVEGKFYTNKGDKTKGDFVCGPEV